MPFDGESVGQIVAQALTGVTRRPIEHVPDLPRELDGIVMRAIARARDERFASLNALIAALEQVALPSTYTTRDGGQVTTQLATPTDTNTVQHHLARALRWRVLAALLALCALTAVGVLYWRNRAQPRAAHPSVVPPLPAAQAPAVQAPAEQTPRAPAPVSTPMVREPVREAPVKTRRSPAKPLKVQPEPAPAPAQPAPASAPEVRRHRSGALGADDM